MKRIVCLLVWITLYGLFMTACKHDLDPTTPVPEKPGTNNPKPSDPETGAVQPVGVPQGTAVMQTIGPAGGAITSEDDRFTVTIPAGALTKDVAISVQRITNTNGAGIGDGYRMLPDGQQFAKPVTMTVNYTAEEGLRSLPKAFGIAYQNAKGVWMAVGGTQVDTTNRRVSIDVNHFTDFTFFEYVYLEPELSAIDPGQSVDIKLFGLSSINWLLEDFPKGAERPLPKPTPIDYLDGWEVQGEGHLVGAGTAVTYQSPGQLPNTNPVRVVAKLKSPGKEVAQLISTVYVLKEGISLQPDGGDWVHFPKAGAHLRGNIKGLDGENGQQTVNIKWEAGSQPRNSLGIFPWGKGVPGIIYRPNPITEYTHLYIVDKKIYVSPGSLNANSMLYGVIFGTFDVKLAGVIATTIPPVVSTSSMRGVFRVKCMDCVR
ncbi:hypothetical protein [Larkinella terrae]|uniref:ZU5 domain-containing protein n=1 Tax=Larkinella terrae TaxID=2025311 RepID=A0A7K0EKD2_9BACT|nr:hypothetical protein [Larkinella terrae]MRS62269.1 hypothetical protein [Larkinella terrae]